MNSRDAVLARKEGEGGREEQREGGRKEEVEEEERGI